MLSEVVWPVWSRGCLSLQNAGFQPHLWFWWKWKVMIPCHFVTCTLTSSVLTGVSRAFGNMLTLSESYGLVECFQRLSSVRHLCFCFILSLLVVFFTLISQLFYILSAIQHWKVNVSLRSTQKIKCCLSNGDLLPFSGGQDVLFLSFWAPSLYVEILQMMLDRSFPITSIKMSFRWCGLFLNFTLRVLNLWSIP